MDVGQALVIRTANRLGWQADELQQAAETSGALPGEFCVVIRMSQGTDRLGSLRADYK